MDTKSLKRSMLLFCLAIGILCFAGCKEDNEFDDVNGQDPNVELTDHIHTEVGREFVFSGVIKDEDGIQSIRLQSSDLQIDKTIDLLEIYHERVTTYELSYSFTVPETIKGDNFQVKITVTDLGGRSVERIVTVSLDGDFVFPELSDIASEIVILFGDAAQDVTTPEYTLNVTAYDDKALNYLEVSVPEMNYTKRVEATSGERQLSITEETLVFEGVKKNYTMQIVTEDRLGNKTEKSSMIYVSDVPDYAKMYLADVEDAAALTSDLFGVPMLIDHTSAFNYRARYYNKQANTQICFIPQKTNFDICFGQSRTNENEITNNASDMQKITLPEVGYYEINFNVTSNTLSIEAYTPNDAIVSDNIPRNTGETMPYQLGLCGEGIDGYPNWDTTNMFLLTKDENNPYRYYGDLNLVAGAALQFTITPKDVLAAQYGWGGWWCYPAWRFENKNNGADSNENEYNTRMNSDADKDYAVNMTKVTVPQTGKYHFEFDYHLLRSSLVPVNE